MGRKPEPGEPAKYKYQSVRYTHFDVGPGASFALTADPWSYVYAYLTTQLQHKRAKNRECLERALYYVELAEGFYKAAETVELPTQATLVYYGLLNLAKCFISVEGVPLEIAGKPEHHGLMLGNREDGVVTTGRPRGSTSIYYEFTARLGRPATDKREWRFGDVCGQVPEIHAMAHTLGHVPRRLFVPVEIGFLVNRSRDKLFTEVKYEKKHETQIAGLRNAFYRDARQRYFAGPEERNGWIVFRSKKRSVTNANWPRIYANIRKDYKRFDLTCILTVNGYRYYCNLSRPPYHQLCFVLMMMFYLGAVARYRPTEMRKLLTGELAPIVAEAVAVCPRQYLYQMAGMITKSVCVVPYAKLS